MSSNADKERAEAFTSEISERLTDFTNEVIARRQRASKSPRGVFKREGRRERVMRSPDPWNKRPPRYSELTDSELIEFLGVAGRSPAFNDFEVGFCASVAKQIRRGYPLSQKQIAVLMDRGLLRRLWDNDPDLWKELDNVMQASWAD